MPGNPFSSWHFSIQETEMIQEASLTSEVPVTSAPTRGHYLTPTPKHGTFFLVNPTKLPYICCLFDSPKMGDLMIPAPHENKKQRELWEHFFQLFWAVVSRFYDLLYKTLMQIERHIINEHLQFLSINVQ